MGLDFLCLLSVYRPVVPFLFTLVDASHFSLLKSLLYICLISSI
jgi:hypothetical protein